MAYTWRKSSFSAPGTVPACHVSPPSVVRTNVPPVPLDQTTLPLTMLNPSRLASVFDFCGCHWAKAAAVMTAPAPTGARNVRIRTFFILECLLNFLKSKLSLTALVRRKIIADDLAALHHAKSAWGKRWISRLEPLSWRRRRVASHRMDNRLPGNQRSRRDFSTTLRASADAGVSGLWEICVTSPRRK